MSCIGLCFSIHGGCRLKRLRLVCRRRSAMGGCTVRESAEPLFHGFHASKLALHPGKLRRIIVGRETAFPGSTSACQTGIATPEWMTCSTFRNDCQELRESSSCGGEAEGSGRLAVNQPNASAYAKKCSTASRRYGGAGFPISNQTPCGTETASVQARRRCGAR